MLPKSIKNLSFGVRGSDFCDFGKVLGGFEKTNFLLSKKLAFLPPNGVQGGGEPTRRDPRRRNWGGPF